MMKNLFALVLTILGSRSLLAQGQIKLLENSANGTNFSAIKAASDISQDKTWIWPPADGGSGQVLSTNGSGTMSWETVKWTTVAKSSNYSILSTDKNTHFLVTGTTTLTLPSPSAAGTGYIVGFNNSGSNTVTVQRNASETINGSNSFTLAAGEAAVLITDGTNWFYHSKKSSGASGACSTPEVKVFNASGTWTKPSCGLTTLVQCWGAGGGGGGVDSGGGFYVAGGGGGGAFNTTNVTTSSLGATETVTIGAGGSAGASPVVGGSYGSAGGTTSFGSWLTVYGGGGGGPACGGGGGGTAGAGSTCSVLTGGNGGNASGGAGGADDSDGADPSVALGPTYATSAADGGGSFAWTNPGNATATDDSKATRSIAGSGTTNELLVTNFGFSVPGGSFITGIRVSYERMCSSGSSCRDYSVRLIKGGVVGSTNKATATNWGTSDGFANYGNSSDVWGETWTDADINASNFGVAIAAQNVNGSARTASIDSVRITVTYFTGGGGGGAGAASTLWTYGGSAYYGGGGGSGGHGQSGEGGGSTWGGGGGNAYGSNSQFGGAGSQGDGLPGLSPGGGGGAGNGYVDGGSGGDGRCVITTF